jgi:SAM-dependent methyltransferase
LAVLYGLTIFLGAFLLFQMQPVVGKMILPWFGGSASVWTTCMLFFQVLLLAGYLYSHWIVTYLSHRRQTMVHICLLLLSLFLLPLSLTEAFRPTGTEDPTVRILLLLTFSVGLPYFVLSTTGPLVQAWFARERPDAVPYRLFALSNLGSLVALLSYPVVVEPLMPTRWQAWLWSLLFLAFIVSFGLLAWRGSRLSAVSLRVRPPKTQLSISTRMVWIALAACPSMLLLAITSYLTENIAPVPLLWVIPLALYLLSFVICFGQRQIYDRRVFRPLLLLSLFALAGLPFLVGEISVFVNLSIHLAALFVVCMVCHGELAMKQPHPEHLTSYYLLLATGGAMGGLFIGALAPYWFNDKYELSIGLILTAFVVWSLATSEENHVRRNRKVLAWSFVGLLMVSLVAIRVTLHWAEHQNAELVVRNFYGRLKVVRSGTGEEETRVLMHGGIMHGHQFTTPKRHSEPTSYYIGESGVARALLALQSGTPMNVGLVGLGIGTLLAYGRPGDYFRIYEIDPLVVDVARSHFSHLDKTAARSDVILGDARLSLEKEKSQQFDLLIMDAFSGDAVPIHLLTREAFLSYLKHLKPGGVLAVHVTNKYLNLDRVVKAAADSLGYRASLVMLTKNPERRVVESQWVLMSADSSFFDKAEIKAAARQIAINPGVQVWRDDYSSLLGVLKWNSEKSESGRLR